MSEMLMCDRCKAMVLRKEAQEMGWLSGDLYAKNFKGGGSKAQLDVCAVCRPSLQVWLGDPTSCPYDTPTDTSVSEADRSPVSAGEPESPGSADLADSPSEAHPDSEPEADTSAPDEQTPAPAASPSPSQ